MQILVIAVLAIFLGASVGNIVPLVWPGNVMALTVVSILVLFLNGLAVRRFAGAAAGTITQTEPQPRTERPRREAAPAAAPVARAPAASGATEDGQVKWFNRTKGYGFIVRPNGEEIFVHQRSIIRTDRGGDDRQRPVLRDGQAVRFTVGKHDKGLQAENVQPLD